MDRDLTLFPNDNIGDALWQMQQAGDDLEKAREVEFSVLFPSQVLALQFGQLLLENNQKLSFTPFHDNEALLWEITAYPEMSLNYDNISAYQELLETTSVPLQGKFDGFYCL
ncbi:ribonuclease E inhibitor RraB [Candidatus Colwellia aromaticivorans]|uniref:ribonuclease E inhibitor RraB n=1 Tax=Candidatus Colwellia aromaticivorans TaxID=2267621 RepID=UPI000DF19A0B|nr:ribonuclease E inhibitor RraB [Candidatus Colwellia aromaticivorans]